MSGATEDLDIRDVTDRWPVTSSAVLADGSLVRLRRDTVRHARRREVAGSSSSTPARSPCSPWTRPAGCC